MGFLSSLLSGLKGGLDQGIMKTLPGAGVDPGMVRGFMPVQPGQMPELQDNAQTMLGALLQKNPEGQRSILGNLGGILKNPEAWANIGAAMKDISEGGSENLMNQQKMGLYRQAMAQQAALKQKQDAARKALNEKLFGMSRPAPNAPSVESMVNGIMSGDPNAPTLDQVQARQITPPAGPMDAGRALAEASGLIDTKDIVKAYELAHPKLQQFDSGLIAAENDPSLAGTVQPKAPFNGAVPIFDKNRNVLGYTLPETTGQAIRENQAAQTAGQQGATLREFPLADGRSMWMTGDQYQQAMQGGGIPGLGIKPSAAQQAGDEIIAKAGANATTNLPQVVDNANYMLGLIQSLKNDPSLGARTGLTGVLPAIPGTPGVSFDSKVAQLKGNTFLQAYNTLRGGGQITEVEGRKAEDAIARLNRAQGDQDFRQALDDLESVVQIGLQRAQRMSQMGPAATGGAGAMPSPGGFNQADLIAEARRRGLIR